MAQQLNLIDPSFRRNSNRLNVRTMLIAAASVYVLLVVLNGAAGKDRRALEVRKNEAENRLVVAKAELEKATAAAKKRDPDKRLVDEIARLELKLQVHREVLAALETGGLGDPDGFSRYLTALAKQRVDGVWLTRIAVSAADSQLVLAGRMLRAELLPAYIRVLNRDEALRGKRFGELRLVTQRAFDDDAAGGRAGGGAPSDARPPFPNVVEFQLGGGAKN
jgi:hypothetical protein